MLEAKTETTDALKTPDTTGGQDVSVMFAALAGMAALSLAVQGMLAYMLLPEGRGAYAVCIVFGTMLGLLFAPGAAQGAQYFVAARRISVSQGVSSILIIGLVGGGIGAVLALPLIYSDLSFFQNADTNTFLLTLLLTPLTAISVALDHQLVAQRRFMRLALFSILRAGAHVLAILFLVRLMGFGVNGAIIALAVNHCVLTAACLLDLRRHCGLVFEMPGRSSLAGILGYGLKYYIARIGSAVEAQIGVVVLGLLAGKAEVGLFAAAMSLMLGFLLISNSVGNALFPRVAGSIERSELVARCARLVCAATAGCLIVMLAFSAPLVRLLLSEAFLPALPLFWILAPGIVAYAGAGIFMTHFKGVNLPHVCSWAVFLGLCGNVCAFLLLYPRLGMEAAAWATTFGLAANCLFLSIVFHRTTGTTWHLIWLPRRSDASFLWTAGASVLTRGVRRKSAA